MTFADLSADANRCWEEKNAAADLQKDPTVVAEWLLDFYQNLDDTERLLFNGVLSTWLASDERHRYDAQFLIRELRIAALVPNLVNLANQLATTPGPGAKFEREKVLKLVQSLLLPAED